MIVLQRHLQFSNSTLITTEFLFSLFMLLLNLVVEGFIVAAVILAFQQSFVLTKQVFHTFVCCIIAVFKYLIELLFDLIVGVGKA
jgi:hypothetical protein